MLTEHRVRLHHLGHFLESLFAQLLADHREGLALAVTQSEAPGELVAHEAMLRHQVRIAQQ